MKQGKIKNNIVFLSVLLIMATICATCDAMDNGLWNLPQIPNSQLVWKDKPLNINGIAASSTLVRYAGPREEIMEFYKDALISQGWGLQASYLEANTEVFTKGNRFFYVYAIPNVQDLPCDTYLISSPADILICNDLGNYFLKEELADDMPGRDLADIPRYPGSKRRVNIDTPMKGEMAMYEVEAEPKTIAQFYRQNLKANGWQEQNFLAPAVVEKLVTELKQEMAILIFLRGKDTFVINIMRMPKPPGSPQAKDSKRSIIVMVRNMDKQLNYPAEGEKK